MRKTNKTLLSVAATVAIATSFNINTAEAAKYNVKSGDTLWAIAQNHSTSVDRLQDINNISDHLIYPDQIIETGSTRPGEESYKREKQIKSASVSANVNSTEVIAEAKKHIGTPYVWGGSRPGAFDCSGFIHYVLNQAGKNVTRTNAQGYYNMSTKTSNPQPGDLVFFKGTYKPGISHMGIYIGNGKMIQAGSSTGVTISDIKGPYWSDHFAGYGHIQ